MLTNEALNVAMPLTTILDSKRITVEPIPNTPLFEMVRATRSDSKFVEVGQNNEFNPSLIDIEYIANCKDADTGISQHDAIVDELSEKIGNAVREHMVFAKNVVAPVVEELVTNTVNTLQELKPATLLGMEVITWNPPKPMLNTALESAVRKFDDLPYDDPSLAMKLPNLTTVEIVELMQSGSSGLDKDIYEWASIKGDIFFIKLWESVFQIKQASLNESKSITFRDFVYDPIEGWDNALAIYLLARRLADNPLPETEMNLNFFNKLIIEYRNQAAGRLAIAYNELNKIEKIGQLIKSIDGPRIIVNESVYKKWIMAGGDNEVLFGNLLNQSPTFLVDELNEQATKLKALWTKHAALTAIVERNKLFVRTKDVLSKHFQKQIRDVQEGEEAMTQNREIILKRFNDALELICEDEISDIWKLCLSLVCQARFYRTEAFRILSGIERVKKENPSISVREAAAVSVIEYCSWWVSTQFKARVN